MEPDPKPPEVRPASAKTSAWTWWGFTLLVLGVAGLLFHWVQGVPILNTGEGVAALVALAGGLVLLTVGLTRR
jgi:hypothetical protein